MHRLEDHAQVVLVVEAAEHLDAVALVVGVAVGELLEVADLLLTRTAHHLVGALHLDRDLLRLGGPGLEVLAAEHRREDALTVRAEHLGRGRG